MSISVYHPFELSSEVSISLLCVICSAYLSLILWHIITLKRNIFTIACCLNSKSVGLLQRHWKAFVQCIVTQWRLVHVSCSLKGLKMVIVICLKRRPSLNEEPLKDTTELHPHQGTKDSVQKLNVSYSMICKHLMQIEKTCKKEIWDFFVNFCLTTEHNISLLATVF